jgi:tetratricopeptide (TPR) repeat protein
MAILGMVSKELKYMPCQSNKPPAIFFLTLMIALIPVFVLTESTSVARSKIAQARHHFLTGKVAYDAGDYRFAIKEFLAGYHLYPKPAFLINIAQSYRKVGQPEDALLYFKTYLEIAPSSRMRQELERLIHELKEEQARINEKKKKKKKAASRKAIAHVLTDPKSTPRPRQTSSTPFYKRWWFWTALGIAVSTGVGTGIYFGTRERYQDDASMGVVRW